MLAWHNIWMASHARQLVGEAKEIGEQVATGRRPLTALAVIAGVAVLREGSEIVLFVYSVAAASNDGALAMLAGGLIGLLAGSAVGVVLYQGLLRIPVHRLFAVTGWMVLLLAAGLAAQAAGFLNQADLLPTLGDQVWDTSFILSEESIVGRTLHTLVGYVARPDGAQIIAYVATLLAIGLPMLVLARNSQASHQAAIIVLLALATQSVSFLAHAELQVRMPTVEFRELEFEHNGFFSFDKDPALGGQQSYTNSIGYGVTPVVGDRARGRVEFCSGKQRPLHRHHYGEYLPDHRTRAIHVQPRVFRRVFSVRPEWGTQQLHPWTDRSKGTLRCPGCG